MGRLRSLFPTAVERPLSPDAELATLVRPDLIREISTFAPLGAVIYGRGPTGDAPEPIPGRVLVKIAASEIADSFAPGDRSCRPERLQEVGLLPRGLGISRLRYAGYTRAGRLAVAVDLEEPLGAAAIRRAFVRSKAELSPETTARLTGPASTILVNLDRADVITTGIRLCEPTYFYLREESPLQDVFRSAGVQSMRRVFRSAEYPDPDRPGRFRVRPLAELLAAAKQRYPERAARAYENVGVPDNVENWFLVRLAPGADLHAAITELEANGGIEHVAADYPFLAASPQGEPEYPNQWGLFNGGTWRGNSSGLPGFDINVVPAWADATPAQPVIVAVLDTGFKEDLDELANRLWTNPDETPGDGIDDDCNGYIDDVHGITTYDRWEVDYSDQPACSVSPGEPSTPLGTHGTGVAGVIAADATNSVGIAGTVGEHDVQLMNVTIGWCSIQAEFGTGSAELAEGIMYALEKGADIANMSVSASGMPLLLQDAVHMALDQGMILVASAGNDGHAFTVDQGYQGFVVYPASMPGVIAVGGAQRDGLWWPGSNYGPGLDLVAPATEVTTITFTDPAQTTADIIDTGGTSMSAAFVSGGAAIVLGKYPTVTAPFMRSWLRATARDIVDPLGVGATIPGEDPWTGAGMLDVGEATVALADVLDQPLEVDILVQRLALNYHFSDHKPDAVAGRPDLGITVDALDPAVVDNWWLEIGAGDAPLVWSPINILTPGVTDGAIDVPRSGSSYYRHTDVAPGRNDLDTDALENNQLYTVRLVAENAAGREFIAYDYVIPTRADISLPSPSTDIVGRWGWAPIQGFVDIRAGASYTVTLQTDAATPIPLWISDPFEPSERYAALLDYIVNVSGSSDPSYYEWLVDVWGTSASAFFDLMHNASTRVPGYIALFPPVAADGIPEGWMRYELTVQSPTGYLDSDLVRMYLDNSHFPYAANWPVTVRTDGGSAPAGLRVADVGDGLGPKTFVHTGHRLVSLDSGGNEIWALRVTPNFRHEPLDLLDPARPAESMAIDDVDGDGISEILVAGAAQDASGAPSLHVFLLRPDPDPAALTTPPSPQLYNTSWPLSFPFVQSGNFKAQITSLRFADVAGDAEKEIIFYQTPIKYYGILSGDIKPGYLHVVDKDGNPVDAVWPMEFPPEQASLPLEVGDVDGDGKEEILLGPERILAGDGTFLTGWDADTGLRDAALLADIDMATPELEVLRYRTDLWGPDYTVTVLNLDGSVATGWPYTYDSQLVEDPTDPATRPAKLIATTGQVVAGGDPEVILCANTIRVLDSQAVPVPTTPEIDLQGSCASVGLLDVDADGTDELVALVNRVQRDVPPDFRRGSFVEAYELDGTPLASTDDRWPIVVSIPAWYYTQSPSQPATITIADVDGDGDLELVQVSGLIPYHGESGEPYGYTRIEVLELR